MDKLVAIHQPNFFPWLGFFDKMRRADVFVLMDNVQFPKKGGSWMNRVRLLVSGKPSWVTMPVRRDYHGYRTIAEMEIDDSIPWRKKLVATLKANYSRASFYKTTMDFLQPLVFFQTSSVSEFNVNAITEIARLAEWEQKLILGTSLDAEGSATELLIRMTRAVGGTAYLCGGGADDYQQDHLFDESGVRLEYQHFEHPSYKQFGVDGFEPGLSVVDAMMNSGLEEWAGLLETGRNHHA